MINSFTRGFRAASALCRPSPGSNACERGWLFRRVNHIKRSRPVEWRMPVITTSDTKPLQALSSCIMSSSHLAVSAASWSRSSSAQQHARRAHVAAQRSFFQFAGLGFKLGQSLRPAFGIPKEGHRCLDYARRMWPNFMAGRPSLAIDLQFHQFHAAILRAALLRTVIGHRLAGTKAPGQKPVSGNALGDQPVAHRLGALLAEGLVGGS